MQIPMFCGGQGWNGSEITSQKDNMSETYYQGTNDIWSGKSQAVILKSPPNKLYFAQFSVKPTPLTTESGSEQTPGIYYIEQMA